MYHVTSSRNRASIQEHGLDLERAETALSARVPPARPRGPSQVKR
jgi:hypothetical protein